LHKATTMLAKTKSVVVVEDLAARCLLKNHRLASPLQMPRGRNSSGNWGTRHVGTDRNWSKPTGSSRPPRLVPSAAPSNSRCPLPNGLSIVSVVWWWTATWTRPSTCPGGRQLAGHMKRLSETRGRRSKTGARQWSRNLVFKLPFDGDNETSNAHALHDADLLDATDVLQRI